MASQSYVNVYWYGIVGVAGKGPNYREQYNPDRTIGDIINTMHSYKLNNNGTRIEIYKFKSGNLSKYDVNDPHWSHGTKMSEYLNCYGYSGNDIFMVYVCV